MKKYTHGLLKRKCGIRFWMYFIAIMIGIYLYCGMPARASLGYYEIQDLYMDLTEEVEDTNKLLTQAFEFTKQSPYTIFNSAPAASQDAIKKIQTASKTAALAVATLLLMVEFLRKSINFEWSSKWENILIFLIKILVVKQIVQNTDVIMAYIYGGFDTINKVATGGTIDFLPCKDIRIWHVDVPYRGDTVVEWVYQKITGSTTVSDYRISVDAVRIFYPIKKEAIDQYFVENAGSFEASEYPKLPPTDKASFTPILDKFFLMPYFTFFKIIAIAIYVITIGRCFELCIYTLLAPLPLATFASDVSHDVGRNFLKNYIAVVLQVTVIVVMFIVYSAVTSVLISEDAGKTLFIHIVTIVSLGTGVIKSGTWSKRICGIS